MSGVTFHSYQMCNVAFPGLENVVAESAAVVVVRTKVFLNKKKEKNS